MQDITCPKCGLLFGRATDDQTLAVKHKDLYRTFHRGGSGWVDGPCRRCGAPVRWPIDLTIEKGDQ